MGFAFESDKRLAAWISPKITLVLMFSSAGWQFKGRPNVALMVLRSPSSECVWAIETTSSTPFRTIWCFSSVQQQLYQILFLLKQKVIISVKTTIKKWVIENTEKNQSSDLLSQEVSSWIDHVFLSNLSMILIDESVIFLRE